MKNSFSRETRFEETLNFISENVFKFASVFKQNQQLNVQREFWIFYNVLGTIILSSW